MLEKLKAMHEEAISKLEEIRDDDELRQWKSTYLGSRGAVRQMLSQIGQLSKEERPAFGKLANEVRDMLEEAFTRHEELIRSHAMARDLEEAGIDVTLPGRSHPIGGLHPSTQVLRQFYDVWSDMGFHVFRSRDVEDDSTNFEMLNFPPHHPARDMQDTIFTTKPNIILRTHTSPGQIHAMHQLGGGGTQPIRVILPGMCYRYEQITARSEVQFTQVEGLAIGHNIRMSDLKGTITEFARRMYGEDAAVRFRASYFPFTEPSMEVDVECFLCGGDGCAVCKHSGWLEIAGSGMVHPVVLQNGGYDPTEWSGFAFGMGPERVAMLKHGIEDIRYFWRNDLRFLEQF